MSLLEAASLPETFFTVWSNVFIGAQLAGIRVFATGGIGGVHRGGQDSLDVSADLAEIGRAPVGSSPGFFERLRGAPRFGDCSRCTAGRYFATVMPDGLMVPCHLTMGQGGYLNGREVGFTRAFLEMPRPTGPGCAISPYNESDLIFSLDSRAVRAAVRRAFSSPGRNAKG